MHLKIRKLLELYSGLTLPPTYQFVYRIISQTVERQNGRHRRRRLRRPFCRRVVAAVHWTINAITRQSSSRIICRCIMRLFRDASHKPPCPKSASVLLRMPIDGEYCSCLRLGDGVIWSSGGWTKEKADEGEKDDGLPTQQQRFIITPRIEQHSLCPSV